MKRIIIATALVAALAGAPAVAQKVYVDFDKDAPFSSYETYAWKSSGAMGLEDESPLMHQRFLEIVDKSFSEGGLQRVESNPDLWITYYAEGKEETRLNTSHMGYGWGPGWGWDPYYDWGMGSSHTTSYTYTKGTLIVDIIDASNDQLIFRGTSTAIVPDKPEKMTRQMEKAVKKMGKEFDKKAKKMGIDTN